MNQIGLASGVLPEFDAETVIRCAGEAGFEAAGLWIEPQEWTPARIRGARGLASTAGVAILDVEVIWIKPESVMDDHRRTIEIGAALGARNALCVISDCDLSRARERFASLCADAESAGLRLALEFGVFTSVKSLSMARAIVDAARSSAAAILVDPIHVDRSGATVSEIAAVPRALLPYAQFCDAPSKRPDLEDFDAVIEDAIDLRAQLGQGELPLADLLKALPENIPLSIELRSKALRDTYADPLGRARAVAGATRRWLKENAC